MRATGQTQSLTGPLAENERRLVAARAILGEWLGGSGGGWQDSGGVWPGMKLIEGVPASEGDPEFGISRGRLLPQHQILDQTDVSAETRQTLAGEPGAGARRHGAERRADSRDGHGEVSAAFGGRMEGAAGGDARFWTRSWTACAPAMCRRSGAATERNFFGPIQTIIPWATQSVHRDADRPRARARSARISGASGCWAACPAAAWVSSSSREAKSEAQERLQEIMRETKRRLEHAVPFAMEPVVYDFAINEHGTFAELLADGAALMPPGYYTSDRAGAAAPGDALALDQPGARNWNASAPPAAARPRCPAWCRTCSIACCRARQPMQADGAQSLAALLDSNGFDRAQHEQIRADLRSGRIGLAQNRLAGQQPHRGRGGRGRGGCGRRLARALSRNRACRRWRDGMVAVVSLAGGAGSRWTKGAGVVKGAASVLQAGRTGIAISSKLHLAKSRRISRLCGSACRMSSPPAI